MMVVPVTPDMTDGATLVTLVNAGLILELLLFEESVLGFKGSRTNFPEIETACSKKTCIERLNSNVSINMLNFILSEFTSFKIVSLPDVKK